MYLVVIYLLLKIWFLILNQARSEMQTCFKADYKRYLILYSIKQYWTVFRMVVFIILIQLMLHLVFNREQIGSVFGMIGAWVTSAFHVLAVF